MTDQETQADARKAAEALLLRAEQRLSSPTASGLTNPTPNAAAAGASIKLALNKAQGSIKSAQDKMSASIENIERTAVGKIEGINISSKNTNGSNAKTSDTNNLERSNPPSMKDTLGRAQGSIRSIHEKVSTSLDAVKIQTQEKVSNSLNVVKHIDSGLASNAGATGGGGSETSSRRNNNNDHPSGAGAGAPAPAPAARATDLTDGGIGRLKSGSATMAQEASKSMKSAFNRSFRVAQGKVTASMESLKQATAQQRTGKPQPSQQDIDTKVFSDLATVSEQIELCRSMLSQNNCSENDGSKAPSAPSDAMLVVVGYLEACTPRIASLINAGTAGALGEDALERVLSVHYELQRSLDDFYKTVPYMTNDDGLNEFCLESDGAEANVLGELSAAAAQTDTRPTCLDNAPQSVDTSMALDLPLDFDPVPDSSAATVADTDPTADGGGTRVPGTEWGKTTGL